MSAGAFVGLILAVSVLGIVAIVLLSALDVRREAHQITMYTGRREPRGSFMSPTNPLLGSSRLPLCLHCGEPLEGLTVNVELVPGCPVEVHAICATQGAAA